ncbi:hypothetical protein MT391_11640 [Vibrio sp. 1-Bac 57]
MTAAQQGIYYAFLAIGGIQLIFEMGFNTAIVQHLASTKSKGPKFNAYVKLGMIFFLVTSILLFISLLIYGSWFFSDIPETVWEFQWYSFCFVLSGNVFFSIFYSIKEGMLQYDDVYKLRFLSGLAYSFSLILSFILKLELWALVIAQLVVLIFNFIVLKDIYSYAIKTFINTSLRRARYAFSSIIKFQLKLSVVWITGYFYWNSFTIFYFKYESPEFAGKIAISLAILAAISGASASFVRTKRAHFGNLISQGKVVDSYEQFIKLSKISIVIYLLAVTFLGVIIWYFQGNEIIARLVDPYLFSLLFFFRLMILVVEIMATYLRVFKDEPFFWITLFMNASVPLSIILCVSLGMMSYIFELVIILHMIALFYQLRVFNNHIKLSTNRTRSNENFI